MTAKWEQPDLFAAPKPSTSSRGDVLDEALRLLADIVDVYCDRPVTSQERDRRFDRARAFLKEQGR